MCGGRLLSSVRVEGGVVSNGCIRGPSGLVKGEGMAPWLWRSIHARKERRSTLARRSLPPRVGGLHLGLWSRSSVFVSDNVLVECRILYIKPIELHKGPDAVEVQ